MEIALEAYNMGLFKSKTACARAYSVPKSTLIVSGEVGSTLVVSRSSLATGFLASNEMSDYEGCTKEEGEAVC
ncbi:hypothetical protein BJX66DRAFT_317521, partial [Aspergillus keveii]|jgi:hypothetical protein